MSQGAHTPVSPVEDRTILLSRMAPKYCHDRLQQDKGQNVAQKAQWIGLTSRVSHKSDGVLGIRQDEFQTIVFPPPGHHMRTGHPAT